MSLVETLRLAARSLSLHKLRSLLTTLGIVFGVAAVVSMVSIGEGARRRALEEIEALGIRNIRVTSARPVIRERGQEQQRNFTLSYGLRLADRDHLAAVHPEFRALVPVRDLRQTVWAGPTRTDLRVFGTTPEYLSIHELGIRLGRFLAPHDVANASLVCVLGAEAARTLFPIQEPVGREVRVAGRYFRVVGVLAPRGVGAKAAVAVADVNQALFIPLSTCLTRFGRVTTTLGAGSVESVEVELDELIAHVADVDAVGPAAAVLQRALAARHPEGDYEVVVPLELLRQRERAQRTFKIVMISIAAISLLVGGIGVMNIMLANVVERTQEIGTRRALGARRRDILRQFLVEAVVLSCVGGLLGLGLGLGIALGVALLARWPIAVTPVSLVGSLGIAGLVGIVFGTYPAYQAARLDPIVALRAE